MKTYIKVKWAEKLLWGINTEALSPVSIQIKQWDFSYHKLSPPQHSHQNSTMSVMYLHGPWDVRRACKWVTACPDTELMLVLCKSLRTIAGSKYTYPWLESSGFVPQKAGIAVQCHSPTRCRSPCGSLGMSACSGPRRRRTPGRCSAMAAIPSQPPPARVCSSASL